MEIIFLRIEILSEISALIKGLFKKKNICAKIKILKSNQSDKSGKSFTLIGIVNSELDVEFYLDSGTSEHI